MTDPLLLAAELLARQVSESRPIEITPQPVAAFDVTGIGEFSAPETLASSGGSRWLPLAVSPPEFSEPTLHVSLTQSLSFPRTTTAAAGNWEPVLPPLGDASRYLPPPQQSEPTKPVRTQERSSETLRFSLARSSAGEQSWVRPQPVSGAQLYQQRLAALKAGRIYTTLPPDSFSDAWVEAKGQPTYQDWQNLLAWEARAIARGKGNNRLGILLGDSISMWFPQAALPQGQFWLNQGISGDTTGGILSRLWTLSETQPDMIYLLAGINDLRRGDSDNTVLNNMRSILRRLRQEHPQAQVVVQSILPTRLPEISNSRIRNLNLQLQDIAREEGAQFFDLHYWFTNSQGDLRPELTTDGLHLNGRGYQVWNWALQRAESALAMNQLP